MGFQFRLKSVLAVRKRERSLNQQSVAEARAELGKQAMNRDRLLSIRVSSMNELRRMNDGANWNVEQVIARQSHVDQLANELDSAEAAVEKCQTALQTCLARLLAADQSVRALEMLAERRLSEYEESLAKSSARE